VNRTVDTERSRRVTLGVRAFSLSAKLVPIGLKIGSPFKWKALRWLTAAVGLVLFLGSLPSPAAAEPSHPLKTTFAAEAGRGISVEESTGNVVTATAGSGNTVLRFYGPEGGAPSGLATTEVSIAGEAGGPGSVAFDNGSSSPDQGDLYVADTSENVVRHYGLNGGGEYELIGSFFAFEPVGISVNGLGEVYVAARGEEEVIVYSPGGEEEKLRLESEFRVPEGVVVDAAGDAYVLTTAKAVYRYAADGSGTVGPGTRPTLVVPASEGVLGISADGTSGDLYARLPDGEIAQYDGTGALVTEFGSPSVAAGGGLAVDASTKDIFAGDDAGAIVGVFGTQSPPEVVTGAASGATPTGEVDLGGTVNPLGASVTTCYFEYGISTSYGQVAPCVPGPAAIGTGSAPVTISSQLTSLAPGVYHFRVTAVNANGSATGSDETFAIPGPPAVIGETALASASEASLRALVDPGNQQTTVYFEYGPTSAYGQTTTARTIAAGGEVVPTSTRIDGLSAGATYHFRAVATNATGTSEGADTVFTTEVGSPPSESCPTSTLESPGWRSYLPECRAYELVSPSFTGGGALTEPFGFLGASEFPVSANGERVVAGSLGTFAGQETGYSTAERQGTDYLLSRSSEGWQPEALNPPQARFPFANMEDASTELTRTLWTTSPTAPLTGSRTYYLREADGSFIPVGPDTHDNSVLERKGDEYKGGSADLSRVVFSLQSEIGSVGRAALWPGDTTIGYERKSLYEYAGTGNSEPRLVGVSNQAPLASNNEAHLISQCGTHLGWSPTGGTYSDLFNAISPSGFAVFFTPVPGPCETESETGNGPAVEELYARVESSRTLDISEPSFSVPGRQCTGVCRESEEEIGGHGRQAGLFRGASADGRMVYFISSQPLVDADTDIGPDLYLAELNSTEVTRLVDVSEGGTGDPTPGHGAEVQGVVRVSSDGSRVYFVAKGVLTDSANANGEGALPGSFNLYAYDSESGRTSFVTRLSAADESDWMGEDSHPVQASAGSGRFLAFLSQARPLGTDDSSEAAQLFLYDAADGSLRRASVGQRGTYPCAQTGELEQGYNCDGNVQSQLQQPTIAVPAYAFTDKAIGGNVNIAVTTDGTVFFTSNDALTPGAANGYPGQEPGVRNVYEYRGGDVYLISDGREAPTGATEPNGENFTSTFFRGALADGHGVLLSTADQLVPQDTDSIASLYDAQIDGGFPARVASTTCPGAGCRESAASPAPIPNASSTTQTGAGNVGGTECAKRFHRSRSRCVKNKPNKKRHKRKHHGKRAKKSRRSGR
jgi:hypothetical protein